MPVYDDQNNEPKDETSKIRPDLPGLKALDNEQLGKKETEGKSRAEEDAFEAGAEEKKGLFNKEGKSGIQNQVKDGVLGTVSGAVPGGALGKLGLKLSKKMTKKNATILGGGSAVVVSAVFLGFVALGPIAMIHFSQFLQRIHLRSNEDFGDSRLSGILLAAALGRGSQDSRLGIFSNGVADKWEANLLKETGLRPVYSGNSLSPRFIGFEMVDEKKAEQFLGDAGEKANKRDAKALERMWGAGADIKQVKDTADNVRPTTPRGNPIDGNKKIIDLSSVSFSERKKFIKIIGGATDTFRVTSFVGSKLMVKRGGVDLHPMNKLKDKIDKKSAGKKTAAERKQAEKDAIKEQEELEEKEIREGVEQKKNIEAGKDAEDKQNIDDLKTSDEVSKALEEYDQGKLNPGSIARAAAGPAIVAGVACMIKGYSENIDQYQHTNAAMPMMRIAGKEIAKGDQIKSMMDYDMLQLAMIEAKKNVDPKTKQSFSAAQLYQAEQGKEGGVPPKKEVQLASEDKPPFFEFFDSLPLVQEVCDVQNFIGGLPIIKQIGSVASSVTSSLLNGGLGIVGTSTDEIMESSFKTLLGKGVNTKAVGPERANLAMVGGRLFANDLKLASGGNVLSSAQSAALRADTLHYDKQEFANSGFFERYFDVKDDRSLTGKGLAAIYNNPGGRIELLQDPTANIASIFGSFLPSKTASAAIDLNKLYGVPEIGYSLEEQRDERFADPLENARIVEPQLDQLNSTYGNCFATKITLGETGEVPQIESGKSVNQRLFVQRKGGYENCGSKDEIFQRYRFYIADTIATVSLACYQGDDKACEQIQASGTDNEGGSQEGEFVEGSDQELAKKIVDSSKFTADPRYAAQIKAYADGKSNCHINSTILQLLATVLDKGYSITVSSLNRKCTGVLTASGTASYHYADKGGHAVDISKINGSATTGRDENAQKLLRDILDSLPKGSGIGQSGCGGGVSFPDGITEFGDTCNHLHIQVPKQ